MFRQHLNRQKSTNQVVRERNVKEENIRGERNVKEEKVREEGMLKEC